MANYKRSLDELRKRAVLHWPDAISEKAGDVSVLPLLLKTQDEFISLLKVASSNPFSWVRVLPHSKLSGTLFLNGIIPLT